MSVSVRSVTVDCADPRRMARFWSSALGWAVTDVDDEGAIVASDQPGMPRLLFLAVPEQKTVKNRWHLDLQPAASMAAEVARLEGLGASVVRRVAEAGSVFTVMADVEGNEFCVERSPAERENAQ